MYVQRGKENPKNKPTTKGKKMKKYIVAYGENENVNTTIAFDDFETALDWFLGCNDYGFDYVAFKTKN